MTWLIISALIWTGWGAFLFRKDISKLIPGRKKKVVAISTEKKKSAAFVKGYSDMGVHAGRIPYQKRVRVRDPDYKYSDIYTTKYVQSVVVDKDNNPSFDDASMRRIAIEVLEAGRVLDPEKGQCDHDYLGGSAEQFNDYYQGGMKFLADIDAVKGVIRAEQIAQENKEALVAARKKGLKEINEKIIVDMKALDQLREGTFTRPLEDHEEWNKQMKEIA